MSHARDVPPTRAPTCILLVEDDRADAYILRRMLEVDGGQRFAVEHVQQLGKGLDRLAEGGIDVVLLDLGLPDSFGLETFHRVNRQAPDVPVVVLSGLDDEAVGVQAVREGAQDYLVKGNIDGQLLVRAIRYAIERHQTQELLRNLSLADDLTGLYNRRGFLALAEQQVKVARRRRHNLLLVFIDLDGLKAINDTLGHDAGNQALVETADVLRHSFRDSDIIARLSGDEFVVLLIATSSERFSELETRLYEQIAQRNATSPRSYKLSMSVGCAEFDPAAPRSLDELIKDADSAMYVVKRRRKASA